jgi:tetratricopeptide (TPR) repeat protein
VTGLETNRAEQFDKASRACGEALRFQEDHFWVRYLRGLCHLRARSWVEAKADLTVCLNQRKDFDYALLLRGFAASELGTQFKGEEARARDQQQEERRLELVRRPASIIGSGVGQAGGRAPFWQVVWAAETTIKPAEVDSDLVRLYQQAKEAEFASARADFDRALGQEQDSLRRYAGLANRGTLLIRQERWDEASADLAQAVKIHPDAFQAYVNLAQALQGAGRTEQALATMNQAIQRAPDLPELFEARARLHLLHRHPSAARADFEQAIAREPKNSKSDRLVRNLVDLGRLVQKQGKYPAALAHYNRALHLKPAYVLTQRFRAETLLALGREGEAGQALDRYLAVIKAAPAEVYRARGLIHAGTGQLPAAIEMYTLALRQNPEDALSRCCRGWTYLLVDVVPPALADFEACLSQDAANADALAGRGNARIRLGQVDAALADAQGAEKAGPLTDRLLYNLARIYSQAVAQLGKEARTARPGQKAPTEQRQVLLEEKAIDCLRRALEELPPERRVAFWRAQAQADPAFAPLRRARHYAQLAARYIETGP